MIFNKHSAYEGQHAFLGASKYHWLNYDDHKIVEAYSNYLAKQRGTTLHAFASECIKLRQKLARKNKTLNMYVNDAIDDRMTPEQVLYYSDNCFGTADALGFSDDVLRIYDLKTGVIPAHIEQLEIYAALFCLEYGIKPSEITIELRIYQNDEIIVNEPSSERIMDICDKIINFDKILRSVKKKEE